MTIMKASLNTMQALIKQVAIDQEDLIRVTLALQLNEFLTLFNKHMPTVFEPIGAGVTVALINKFIINNNWLWSTCLGCKATPTKKYDDREDTVSSASTTTVETIEVHAHF